MRLLPALFLLTLLAPLAAADQNLSAGPADVRTSTTTYGGTCASGNGFQMHTVDASLTLPTDTLDAQYNEYCSTYASGSYAQSGEGQWVSVTRSHAGSYGPGVVYSWTTFQDNQGHSYCGDTLALAGANFYLGCVLSALPPTPIGSFLP